MGPVVGIGVEWFHGVGRVAVEAPTALTPHRGLATRSLALRAQAPQTPFVPKVALVVILGVLPVAAVGAVPSGHGSLDRSFGRGGRVRAPQWPERAQHDSPAANALAIQPDGKLVVAGEAVSEAGVTTFALARYNRNGSLDRSFGG